MNKLVSRNPVQRFKEGKQIQKYASGRWFYNGKEVFSNDGGKTYIIDEKGNYVQPNMNKALVEADKVGRNAYKVGNTWYRIGSNKKLVFTNNSKTQRSQNINQQTPLPNGAYNNDSPKSQTFREAFNTARNSGQETFKWGNNTFNTRNKGEEGFIFQNGKWVNPNTVIENSRQSLVDRINSTSGTDELVSNTSPEISYTLGYKEPGAPGSTFTSSGITTTSPQEATSYLKTPTSPVDTGFNNMSTFTRNNIRNYRNVPNGFRNVQQYWNWISDARNQNDNQYKLWQNILQSIDGEEAKKQAFEEIMSQAGIKDNFGRRDSRRIADLLNTFRQIGINGSNERNAFIKAYEPAFMNGYNEQQQIYNNYMTQFKIGGQLVSRNPVQRFKELYTFKQGGNLIPRFNGGNKFFITQRGKSAVGFNTRAEAEAYRKKHKIVGQIYERGQEQKESRVLRADNTKSGHTKYGRQQEESQYNNLSFKQAYNKARSQGKEAFGYKGKVYSTDLGDKATNKNMTRMKNLYGNYLGYQKDPKLQNKQSRAGREAQNKRLNVDDSYKQTSKEGQERKVRRQALIDSASKISQNFTADKLVDALTPMSVIGNTIGQGVAALNGENYNGHLYRSGFNPMGYAQDMMDGNALGVAERGLDAWGWFGAPGLSKAVDWAGTRFAPRISSISSKSAYLGKKATEPIITESGEIIGRQPWKGAVNAISGEAIPKGSMATGKNVTSYGTRSVQRAANEGILEPLAINSGMNNATRFGNAAWRNNNTGLTYVFRNTDGAGNLIRNSYDVAVDNAVAGAPGFATVSIPTVRITNAELNK